MLSWFDESLVIVTSAAKVAAGSATNRDDASASFIFCCFVLFVYLLDYSQGGNGRGKSETSG